MKKLGAAIVLAIVMAGCSSGSDDAVPAPTTEPDPSVEESETSEPTPTAAPTTEAAVPTTESAPVAEASSTTAPDPAPPIETVLADAVRSYFDAREAASSSPAPNPDDPALAEVAASPELERLIQSVQDKADAGQGIRPGEQGLAEIRVGFVEPAGDFATVAACSIDDGVIFDLATGDVVNDEVATHNYRVDLALLSGVWKVTEIVRVQQWEGVGGCALAAGDYPY